MQIIDNLLRDYAELSVLRAELPAKKSKELEEELEHWYQITNFGGIEEACISEYGTHELRIIGEYRYREEQIEREMKTIKNQILGLRPELAEMAKAA